jgi:hypothetical protein
VRVLSEVVIYSCIDNQYVLNEHPIVKKVLEFNLTKGLGERHGFTIQWGLKHISTMTTIQGLHFTRTNGKQTKKRSCHQPVALIQIAFNPNEQNWKTAQDLQTITKLLNVSLGWTWRGT